MDTKILIAFLVCGLLLLAACGEKGNVTQDLQDIVEPIPPTDSQAYVDPDFEVNDSVFDAREDETVASE
jgi:major membrane immunogen (membrane-anchored lipoprotein)